MIFASRYLVVGDLHGNWRGLERLLEQCRYDEVHDRLIFVGDYNDHMRPDTCDVRRLIDLLLELDRRSPQGVAFVRGNHDLWFAQWLQTGGVPDPNWYEQGGRETLMSYGLDSPSDAARHMERIPEAHRSFICERISPYYLDAELLVVHGGFVSGEQMGLLAAGTPLDEAQLMELVWDRHFIFSDDDRDHAWFAQYFGQRYLVTGHSAVGPYVNPRNPKWLLVDSPGRGRNLHAAIIRDGDNHEFIHS